MKKFVALMLAGAMIFSMAACGDSAVSGNAGAAAATGTESADAGTDAAATASVSNSTLAVRYGSSDRRRDQRKHCFRACIA